MRIAITGASGLIGTRLVDALLADGHELTLFTRPGSDPHAGRPTGVQHAMWDPSSGHIDAEGIEGRDAVIHLAGVGIADSRWTDAQKDRILRSRTEGTGLLARTIRDAASPPAVLLSASAIGYYG